MHQHFIVGSSNRLLDVMKIITDTPIDQINEWDICILFAVWVYRL